MQTQHCLALLLFVIKAPTLHAATLRASCCYTTCVLVASMNSSVSSTLLRLQQRARILPIPLVSLPSDFSHTACLPLYKVARRKHVLPAEGCICTPCGPACVHARAAATAERHDVRSGLSHVRTLGIGTLCYVGRV